MAENTESAPATGKSKLKLILMLVVVVLLAVGLSVAGTLWFLQSSDGAAGDTEQAEEQVFQPSQYHVMEKPLVATLQSEGRQRYAQVYLAFAARDPAALAAVEVHMPLIRSQLLSLLGAQSFDELRTVAGRDALIQAMLAEVNQILEGEGEPPVEQVLFRNFVLQ